MDILLTVVKSILILLVVLSIGIPLISHRRDYKFVWHVWKRFRIKMFFEVLGTIVLTWMAVTMLWKIPGLKYGWTTFLFHKGGNVVMKSVDEGFDSPHLIIRLLTFLFFIILVVALPFLARLEEKIFRAGYSEWGSIIKQSIKFGLIHCLVGVPIAAGIALSIPGLFFGYHYKRAFDRSIQTLEDHQAKEEATMVSTTYHTMFNTIVIMLLLLSITV